MAIGGRAEQELAHVFRRLSFGPHPGQVAQWREAGALALIEEFLDPSTPLGGRLPIDPPAEQVFENENWDGAMRGWFRNLKSPRAGLHEKMTWFWHSHLTSSQNKAEPLLMYRQHRLVRAHALGNFRELLAEIVTDGAMLQWLDGDGSVASAPNENLSRELLELFAVGPGHYTETDVRSGARALAGWAVTWPELDVIFRSEDADHGNIRYLGRVGTFGPREIVDAACDHPACARFVTRKLHRFLAGEEPEDATLNHLAGIFRANDLEILPLVRAIVTSPSFLRRRLARPKTAIEWLIGAAAATGRLDNLDVWTADRLGQMPFAPPNPAGWPDGPSWFEPQQQLDRLSILSWWWVEQGSIVAPDATVDDVLERCSLHEISQTTRAGLERAHREAPEWYRPSALFRLALTSPEFQLS